MVDAASEVADSAVVVGAAEVVVGVAVVVGASVASSSAIEVVEADGSSGTETVSVASSPAQLAATNATVSSARHFLTLTVCHSTWREA